jgi:hypothetical protein
VLKARYTCAVVDKSDNQSHFIQTWFSQCVQHCSNTRQQHSCGSIKACLYTICKQESN